MSLPELTRIRQSFASEHVPDVADTVRRELEGSSVRVAHGSRIAVAVGSRGITDLVAVVREVVGWVRSQGSEPFIVPAMGSHGGATAEGQQRLLEQYGLSKAHVGAAIHSSMEVVELDRGDVEVPVYFDAQAAEADGTIVINRIKPHTSFHGPYESGLMKMLAIGLGKQRQAEAIHQLGVAGLRDCMPRVARQVLRQANVLLGVAVVENAYDRTMRVRAIQAAAIPDEEPGLLELARANMPRLPIEDIDVLIVDEMGKNISGLGIDPNIVGRLRIAGQTEPTSPRIGLIVVRDLTEASAGNAVGMGLADVITRRLFEKIDWPSTYENVLTSTFTERGKVPLVADDDREAMEFAMRVLRSRVSGDLRIVRIRNTLQLAEVLVSPAVLKAIEGRSDIQVLGRAGPWFDQAGRMPPI